MSELKVLSNGQVVTLLDGDELGDAGDVLMRVGVDGAAYRPVSDVAAAWGGITGTLSAQTDLQSALDAKAAASTAILHQATVELTDAQIKALPTTPIVIVPATEVSDYNALPARIPIISQVSAVLDTAAGAYTNVSGGATDSALLIVLSSVGDANAAVHASWKNTSATTRTLSIDNLGNFDDAGKFALFFVPVLSPIDLVYDNALAIMALNALGNLTGGNAANTLLVSISYYILNTATGVFE